MNIPEASATAKEIMKSSFQQTPNRIVTMMDQEKVKVPHLISPSFFECFEGLFLQFFLPGNPAAFNNDSADCHWLPFSQAPLMPQEQHEVSIFTMWYYLFRHNVEFTTILPNMHIQLYYVTYVRIYSLYTMITLYIRIYLVFLLYRSTFWHCTWKKTKIHIRIPEVTDSCMS